MVNLHELILEVADLTALSVECTRCKTQVLLQIEKQHNAPKECLCGAKFDRDVIESVDVFIRACGRLRDRVPHVSLRVKQAYLNAELTKRRDAALRALVDEYEMDTMHS